MQNSEVVESFALIFQAEKLRLLITLNMTFSLAPSTLNSAENGSCCKFFMNSGVSITEPDASFDLKPSHNNCGSASIYFPYKFTYNHKIKFAEIIL